MAEGITGVEGIEVGHWSDRGAATGCTVVLCREGAVAGVDVRGGAPGTRETDSLRPGNLVPRVHAIVLSAVRSATGPGGVPSVEELSRG